MKLPAKYDNLSWRERRKAREKYIKLQDGKCMFCKCPLDSDPPAEVTNKNINMSLFPDGFMNNPIHLQHDHISGLTEGAVHAYCNAVLWQYHGK